MAEKAGKDNRNNPPRGPSASGTPKAGTPNLPNRTELTTQMANAPGPVGNLEEAKNYLVQKRWLLIDEPSDSYKLADILFAASLENKVPDHAAAVMRAVGWLLAEQIDDKLSNRIAEATAELFCKRAEPLFIELENHRDRLSKENDFLKATGTKQSETTNQLIETVTKLDSSTNTFKDIAGNLKDSASKHATAITQSVNAADKVTAAAATIDTMASTLKDTQPHVQSLAESAKQLAEVVSALKATKPTTQYNQPTPSWAAMASGATNPSSSPTPYSTDEPSHITRITQRLLTAAKQIYVEYNADDPKAPTDRSGPAIHELRTKFNAWMKEIDTAKNAVTESSGFAIRAISILEKNAILFEFDSVDSAKRFQEYCEHNFLLARLCDSAKIKPRTYRLIFKFVPCDGSFDPNNNDHIRYIEEDQCLPQGAIVSASWVKRPELRSPNQKTANLKVICSSAEFANHFIKDRVYIANAKVEVKKDIQEPLRCNKCHEYGHIRDRCPNPERCGSCAREHPTVDCPNPTKLHCVSCGVSSKHASNDRTKCQHYNTRCQSLDARIPENGMPYFPILNVPWTWASNPKKPFPAQRQRQPQTTQNQQPAAPPPPPPRTNNQQQNQPARQQPPAQPQPSAPPQAAPQNRVQTTLGTAPTYSQNGAPPQMQWQLVQQQPYSRQLPPHFQPNPAQPPLGGIPTRFYNAGYIGDDHQYWGR